MRDRSVGKGSSDSQGAETKETRLELRDKPDLKYNDDQEGVRADEEQARRKRGRGSRGARVYQIC